MSLQSCPKDRSLPSLPILSVVSFVVWGSFFHLVMPFVIASCIVLSAKQSLFKADDSRARCVFKVNLLKLIMFTSI